MDSYFTYSGPGYSGGRPAPAPPPREQPADGYVQRAHPQCQDRGCQYASAAGLLAAAGHALQEGKRNSMSQALWCDTGGHAFSERDPGRQRVTVDVLNEETGAEESDFRDLCGDCAEKAGLLKKRKTRPDAPAPPPARYDPVRTAELERELGIGHGKV